MARKRGRHFRKGRAPGKSFWLRPPAFNITLTEATTGTHSSIILDEADFSDPSIALNDTKKGSPVLERLVVSLGFDMVVGDNYFNAAAFDQTTLLAEMMIYTQSDQFTTFVDSSANFDAMLDNQRILGYAIANWSVNSVQSTGGRHSIKSRFDFEPKSRVMLREKSVGVAIRTNMDIGDTAILSTFPWVQATMLVRVP